MERCVDKTHGLSSACHSRRFLSRRGLGWPERRGSRPLTRTNRSMESTARPVPRDADQLTTYTHHNKYFQHTYTSYRTQVCSATLVIRPHVRSTDCQRCRIRFTPNHRKYMTKLQSSLQYHTIHTHSATTDSQAPRPHPKSYQHMLLRSELYWIDFDSCWLYD